MFERMIHTNEIIGLTMMLLLTMALVASQADATIEEGASAAVVEEQMTSLDGPGTPFTATVEGHFNGKVLTISIDTMAHFGRFRMQGNQTVGR